MAVDEKIKEKEINAVQFIDIGSFITRSPELCGGEPRIAGTAVKVLRIVGWYKLVS